MTQKYLLQNTHFYMNFDLPIIKSVPLGQNNDNDIDTAVLHYYSTTV